MSTAALVHYGAACLTWPQQQPSQPICYPYTSLPMNISHFSYSFCLRLKQLLQQQQQQQEHVSPLRLSRLHTCGDTPTATGTRDREKQKEKEREGEEEEEEEECCSTQQVLLVYDTRYHYALPCMLQHIAPLFLPSSPHSSVSTATPASSPTCCTPVAYSEKDTRTVVSHADECRCEGGEEEEQSANRRHTAAAAAYTDSSPSSSSEPYSCCSSSDNSNRDGKREGSGRRKEKTLHHYSTGRVASFSSSSLPRESEEVKEAGGAEEEPEDECVDCDDSSRCCERRIRRSSSSSREQCSEHSQSSTSCDIAARPSAATGAAATDRAATAAAVTASVATRTPAAAATGQEAVPSAAAAGSTLAAGVSSERQRGICSSYVEETDFDRSSPSRSPAASRERGRRGRTHTRPAAATLPREWTATGLYVALCPSALLPVDYLACCTTSPSHIKTHAAATAAAAEGESVRIQTPSALARELVQYAAAFPKKNKEMLTSGLSTAKTNISVSPGDTRYGIAAAAGGAGATTSHKLLTASTAFLQQKMIQFPEIEDVSSFSPQSYQALAVTLNMPQDQQQQHSCCSSSSSSNSRMSEADRNYSRECGACRSSSAIGPACTWLYVFPAAWTTRLVFLSPAVAAAAAKRQRTSPLLQQWQHEKHPYPQQQQSEYIQESLLLGARGCGEEVEEDIQETVAATNRLLHIRLSRYTSIANRFIFQVYYSSLDQAVGLSLVIPLCSSAAPLPSAASFSVAVAPAAPLFVPVEKALQAELLYNSSTGDTHSGSSTNNQSRSEHSSSSSSKENSTSRKFMRAMSTSACVGSDLSPNKTRRATIIIFFVGPTVATEASGKEGEPLEEEKEAAATSHSSKTSNSANAAGLPTAVTSPAAVSPPGAVRFAAGVRPAAAAAAYDGVGSSSPRNNDKGRGGGGQYTYTSVTHTSNMYSYSTSLLNRTRYTNEQYLAWQRYREEHVRLPPSPLLLRLLLRFGGVAEAAEQQRDTDVGNSSLSRDRISLQIWSYDPTFFTGSPMELGLLQRLQRLQTLAQEERMLLLADSPSGGGRTAATATAATHHERGVGVLSPGETTAEEDLTAATASEIRAQEPCRHSDGRAAASAVSPHCRLAIDTERREGSDIEDEQEFTDLTIEEKSYFNAERCILSEENRASEVLQRQFVRSIHMTTARCVGLVLLGPPVYRQPILQRCMRILLEEPLLSKQEGTSKSSTGGILIPTRTLLQLQGCFRIDDDTLQKRQQQQQEPVQYKTIEAASSSRKRSPTLINAEENVEKEEEKEENEKRHVVQIAMGEVTPAKLLNFEEVDAVVLFGCPEKCLLLQQQQREKSISQQLLLPADVLCALDVLPWKAVVLVDYAEMLEELSSLLQQQQQEGAAALKEREGIRSKTTLGEAAVTNTSIPFFLEEKGQTDTGVAAALPEREFNGRAASGNTQQQARGYTGMVGAANTEWNLTSQRTQLSLQRLISGDILKTQAERSEFKGVLFREEEEEGGISQRGGTSNRGERTEIQEGLHGVASGYDKEHCDEKTTKDTSTAARVFLEAATTSSRARATSSEREEA